MTTPDLHAAAEALRREAAGRLRTLLDLISKWAPRTTDGGLAGALTETYGFDAKAVMDGTADAKLTVALARDLAAALAPLGLAGDGEATGEDAASGLVCARDGLTRQTLAGLIEATQNLAAYDCRDGRFPNHRGCAWCNAKTTLAALPPSLAAPTSPDAASGEGQR